MLRRARVGRRRISLNGPCPSVGKQLDTPDKTLVRHGPSPRHRRSTDSAPRLASPGRKSPTSGDIVCAWFLTGPNTTLASPDAVAAFSRKRRVQSEPVICLSWLPLEKSLFALRCSSLLSH